VYEYLCLYCVSQNKKEIKNHLWSGERKGNPSIARSWWSGERKVDLNLKTLERTWEIVFGNGPHLFSRELLMFRKNHSVFRKPSGF
jgi:hypothetical protein